jgi:hypothetical protein
MAVTEATAVADPAHLADFAAAVMADAALAAALAAVDEREAFAAQAVRHAAERGLTLDAAAVTAALRPDPLGLARYGPPLMQGQAWPPAAWLPVQVIAAEDGPAIDWAYFGSRRLTESFFEDSMRRALALPFNKLFRYRTPLADFLKHAKIAASLAPDGFVFHMSRCGSTLAAQMFAALPDCVVVSEAPPIDTVLQLARGAPLETAAQALRAIVAAYGRRRPGARRFIVKLDSWHALALPVFQRAFPEAPWTFFYRDPVEVMVSQTRMRGIQMSPAMVPASLFGIEPSDNPDLEDYGARVLGAICRAAAAAQAHDPRGLLVNYRDLPGAVFTELLPHFGLAPDDGARAAMQRVTQQDAKTPALTFAADSAAKQQEATPSLRQLAQMHVGAVYRQLEAQRAAAR